MLTLLMVAAWMLTEVIATYGVWHYLRGLVPLSPAPATPRVVVLVAIKGVNATTGQFLQALSDQGYPDYRLVFALESRSDPAVPLIEGLQQRLAGRRAVDIVIAGPAMIRAQKVHNLLAALGALREDDKVVAFADADILPGPAWLSQLIRPVALGQVAASTGYRWPLPTDRCWPSLILAAADLSIATAARSWRYNLCWGGSMAIDRATLDEIDLPMVWNRAASDDLTMTSALRACSYKINSPLHVLVPTPVAYRWGTLFNFMRRQYLMVRTYAPRHWLLAGWTLCVPAFAATVATTEIIGGRWWLLSPILASSVLLQVRLQIRLRIADLVLPDAAMGTARTTIVFARWAWPMIHVVHLGAYMSSGVGQRFAWGRIDYRLRGKTVTVESRVQPPCKTAVND